MENIEVEAVVANVAEVEAIVTNVSEVETEVPILKVQGRESQKNLEKKIIQKKKENLSPVVTFLRKVYVKKGLECLKSVISNISIQEGQVITDRRLMYDLSKLTRIGSKKVVKYFCQHFKLTKKEVLNSCCLYSLIRFNVFKSFDTFEWLLKYYKIDKNDFKLIDSFIATENGSRYPRYLALRVACEVNNLKIVRLLFQNNIYSELQVEAFVLTLKDEFKRKQIWRLYKIISKNQVSCIRVNDKPIA